MRREVADRETIDLKDVRAFCAVADAGSITAAARLVGETKGSVSRRIARLERALGVSLLRRSPRLVQLTEEGTLYRAKVGRAIELFDDAARSLDDAHDTPRGLLRVTAPLDFATGLLPRICAAFLERYPDVRVEMVASDARLDFDGQQLDCALRVGTLNDSTLKVHKLLDMQLGLFGSPGYFSAHGTPKRPEDLSRHRFVAYASMPRPFEVAFERDGVRTDVALEPALLGDGGFVRGVLLAGGGIGGMPAILAAEDVAAGRLKAALPGYAFSITRPLSFLYPSSAFVSAKLRAFRDFLSASLVQASRTTRRGRVLG